MLERLYLNRCAIFNVLTDKNITNRSLAEKLEIKETEWTLIDSLIKVLKPIDMTTTVLCTEKHSPISMIRPIIKKIIEKHLLPSDDEDTVIQSFKKTIVLELERRFFLDLSPTEQILPEQIASFLDPRYKDLEHEALSTREEICSRVKEILSMSDTINLNDKVLNNLGDQQKCHSNALEYIYKTEFNDDDDLTKQFENYIAEPQLRFTLDPKEWWKTRFSKYPVIGDLAKKYLTIPAISVSSERCFSTAGNIVTRKRASLSPENVNMLVFLHQNKYLLNKT
ncbi:zinc finger BED domain-containing protein 1-like [Sipha flava]|uniref:Zinc finger BED domain-containing protein 1-like n=1 Tax=Sipha flava TaxID=143950 RepID=A0A8B8G026_9HEMI|nr:zinc finger BED domain-containing protein 1-like [Sipha flava]